MKIITTGLHRDGTTQDAKGRFPAQEKDIVQNTLLPVSRDEIMTRDVGFIEILWVLGDDLQKQSLKTQEQIPISLYNTCTLRAKDPYGLAQLDRGVPGCNQQAAENAFTEFLLKYQYRRITILAENPEEAVEIRSILRAFLNQAMHGYDPNFTHHKSWREG